MMRRTLSLVLLCAAASVARAHTHIQDIAIQTGWNAFYLEVTPDDASPAVFFADTPVQRAALYQQDAYAAMEQYKDDGTPIEGLQVSYLFWNRAQPEESTLKTVSGGGVYFVLATNACTLRATGTPAMPRLMWRDTSGTNVMMNIVGASLDAGSSVALSAYFREGPFGKSGVAYSVGGTNSAGASFTKMSYRAKVSGGAAFAATGARTAAWPGVLNVMLNSATGLMTLDDAGGAAGFRVENAGTTSRTVRVTHVASERASEVAPPLRLYVPGTSVLATNAWRAFPVGGTAEKVLAPGEGWSLSFCADPTGVADPEADYGSLLRVEDVDGGTAMRVLVPVTAKVTGNTATAWPKGLWQGTVALTKVNRADGAEPTAAGGTMKAAILMHVGTDGAPVLLQRVVVAKETAADGTVTNHLYKELSDVPTGFAARRISSVVIDLDHRAIAARANPDNSASAFGDQATFAFTVDAKSTSNPFRHPWHPMHDGKKPDFSGDLPTGDDPNNYVGTIKPELFSVTNTITFKWNGAGDGTGAGWSPDQSLSGTVDWRLGGLRTDGEIRMGGSFVLRRVSSISTLEGK